MWRWIVLVAGLSFVPSGPVVAQAITVETIGTAFVSGADDIDSARRRALGDALVMAALAGGAQINGHTAVFNARITSDLTLVRFAGRVLSHQVLSAQQQGGQWMVRIRAIVGPAQTGVCSGNRRLTISALPPAIEIRPDAPAWTAPVAGQLAVDVTRILQAHPATVLDSTAPAPHPVTAMALDYTSITQGRAPQPAGNHRLAQDILVQRHGNRVQLTLDIGLLGPDGIFTTRRFQRVAATPQGGLTGLLTDRSRDRAAHELTAGLIADISAALDELGCAAPQAAIALGSNGLEVPLGATHGLRSTSLGLLVNGDTSFSLLEITNLQDRRAMLRPLDPTRPVNSFAGQQVYFIETGL